MLRTVAIHYANVLDSQLLTQFFANELQITEPSQAFVVCTQFQQLIDIAMMDSQVSFEGVKDIESLLFSLFNLVYHEMLNLGFEAQWQQAADVARTQQSK